MQENLASADWRCGMTLEPYLTDAITEARLHRRKVLDVQLRALMVTRDEQTGVELAKWAVRVEPVMAEIKRMENQE